MTTAGSGPAGELVRIKDVLRVRPFRRLWVVLAFSSLGDWLGLLATSTFAAGHVTGSVAKGAAFGGVIAVRLLPALVLGPIAGVLADRLDRRHTMAVCDVLRFLLFASIPTVGLLVTSPAMVVGWAAVATFAIETLAMMWSPAKEAAVPNLLPANRLEAANQLTLATTYGLTPVLAALVVAGMNGLAVAVFDGHTPLWANPTNAALYFNALTFLVAAGVVLLGIREISGRDGHAGAEARRGVVRALKDGWLYVTGTPLVRGLVTGILVAFAGAGVVIGTAQFYARSLRGGDATFSLLFAVLFAGLAAGVIGGPVVVHALSRRRWFALSIGLAGCSVAVMAAAPGLVVALVACVGTGAGAGMAFLAGVTLLGSEVGDEVRGRVFAFMQTGGRIGLLLSIAVSSVLVGAGGSHWIHSGGFSISISTTRVLLLATGIGLVVAGIVGLRQIDDRPGVPVLRDLIASLRRRSRGAEPTLAVARGDFRPSSQAEPARKLEIMTDAITISGLHKYFGRTHALDGLDLTVRTGEVHGFLGPNGAGKSTTIRVLLGLLRADAGRVRLLGGDPWRDAATLHRRLAYVPGEVALWPNLTGGEVIDLLGRLRGGLDPKRRAELLERFDLDPTKKGRSYSKGNRQKVALVAALASDVELLLLDEPTAGLDPLMEEVFREWITEDRVNGRTVLLSSHILAEAEALCDRVSIIRAGRMVETGTLADLRHLTRTSITAELAGLPRGLADLPGVHDLTIEGMRVRLSADTTELDRVLATLSAAGIRGLASRPPTLEELFLRHYSNELADHNGRLAQVSR